MSLTDAALFENANTAMSQAPPGLRQAMMSKVIVVWNSVEMFLGGDEGCAGGGYLPGKFRVPVLGYVVVWKGGGTGMADVNEVTRPQFEVG